MLSSEIVKSLHMSCLQHSTLCLLSSRLVHCILYSSEVAKHPFSVCLAPPVVWLIIVKHPTAVAHLSWPEQFEQRHLNITASRTRSIFFSMCSAGVFWTSEHWILSVLVLSGIKVVGGHYFCPNALCRSSHNNSYFHLLLGQLTQAMPVNRPWSVFTCLGCKGKTFVRCYETSLIHYNIYYIPLE